MRVRGILKYGLAVAALLGLVVSQATPASAITFNYSQSTGWVLGSATTEVNPAFAVTAAEVSAGVQFFQPASNPDPTLHLGDNLPPPNTYETIGWGCNVGGQSCAPPGNTVTAIDPMTNTARSALDLQGLAGTVDTITFAQAVDPELGWVNISFLQHKNQPIRGATLAEVTAASILRISTTPPTSDADSTVVEFEETLNLAPCATNNTGSAPCEDFFTVQGADFAPLVIPCDGGLCTVEFRLANFVNSAQTFDPITGEFTIFTAENQTSSVNVQMRIIEAAVPEPGTLMLLGTGLLGVAGSIAARRRRK